MAQPLPPENPWAPPTTTALEAPLQGGVWREGAEVVMLRQAELPPRCVRCNAAIVGTAGKQRLYWHHPGWYLLLVLNVFLYVLVVIFVRQTAVIRPGFCPRHRRRQIVAITGAIGYFVVLFGYLFTRPVLNELLLMTGALIGFAAVVGAAWLARTVRPSRIDVRQIRLKGADPAFLDSLPRGGP